jgi:hypothetical protein
MGSIFSEFVRLTTAVPQFALAFTPSIGTMEGVTVGTLHREPVSVSFLRDDVRGVPGCIWSWYPHPDK